MASGEGGHGAMSHGVSVEGVAEESPGSQLT